MSLAQITKSALLADVLRWRGGSNSTDDAAAALRSILNGPRLIRNGLEGVRGVPKDWQHWRTVTEFRCLGGRRFTVSGAVTDGSSTTVTSSSPTNFTTNLFAGCFIEFEDSSPGILHEIKSNTATVFTLYNTYGGVTVASGEDAVVYRPAYALPDNYQSFRSLTPKSIVATEMTMMDSPAQLLTGRRVNGCGVPFAFAIGTLVTDGATGTLLQPRLFFYPCPQGKAVGAADDDADSCVYDLEYNRIPGWLDASTGLWKLTPTSDSDVLDFYPDRVELLHAAIKYGLSKEFPGNPDFAGAKEEFYEELGPALRGDNKGGSLIVPGRIGDGDTRRSAYATANRLGRVVV